MSSLCPAVLALAALISLGNGAVPVIPGASGFGMDTPAGRNGTIIRVTNLGASGEGSLRAALEAKGPRVVVFEVAGVIDMNGASLRIREPFLTLAGQTAPPPGITIIRGSIYIETHDVLIQHVRVRPGDAGRPKRSGWAPDGISTGSSAGQPGCHHVIVDHCSATWAVDENLTASGQRHEGRAGTTHQATFSNCIVAEALYDSSHPKGRHSKGTLIHDHARDIAIIGNLYACNADRNPVLKPDASAVVVNNLIVNPGQRAIHGYWTPSEYQGHMDTLKPWILTAIGNVVWCGADTTNTVSVIFAAADQGEVCARDNIGLDPQGRPITQICGNPRLLDEPPSWPKGLKPLPSARVAAHVLKSAGAFPAQRDPIDRRIIEQAKSRQGRIIDSQEQVGGYPKTRPLRRELDPPANPDADDDGDGYTNLEEWLHAMAAKAEGHG
ncbi:MAG TPA: right-handed parallel beta-helix repeat-containing protein [Verrucomicrobiae bacterium]|nr:right-handed parallel beta-helix repeat-containing protein [Verrucomicrobiae bacterium]